MKKILANDNRIISIEEKEQMKKNLAIKFAEILDILGFDHENDPNLKETPQRVAKMYCDELFTGNFSEPPKITVFPNTKKYDQMIISGPIEVKSTCCHHFVSISGHCFIGYIPGETICGLSKLARVAHFFMRRPQLQEELTTQIAEFLEKELKPKGIIVVIKSEHFCEKMRGVEESESNMFTSCVKGYFLTNPSTKQEFFEMIKR